MYIYFFASELRRKTWLRRVCSKKTLVCLTSTTAVPLSLNKLEDRWEARQDAPLALGRGETLACESPAEGPRGRPLFACDPLLSWGGFRSFAILGGIPKRDPLTTVVDLRLCGPVGAT